MTVRVRVRLFAVQRELAGTREVPLELSDGADVEAAWTALVGHYPVLAPGRPSMRFARNGEYADPDTGLADGEYLHMLAVEPAQIVPPVQLLPGSLWSGVQRIRLS